ncbi:hypothetical protein SUGI_1048780 [Cryptomeria japonica]|nr:hypothetical protein SUGI_1048780 [Cryptomeria japonica]
MSKNPLSTRFLSVSLPVVCGPFFLALLLSGTTGLVFPRNKRRRLTEFNNKLTHFYIMSHVSTVLEISKDRFMTLVRECALQIYKEDIQSVQYFKKHMDMLHPKEVEVLVQYMQKLKLEDSDVLPPRTEEKGTREQ